MHLVNGVMQMPEEVRLKLPDIEMLFVFFSKQKIYKFTNLILI